MASNERIIMNSINTTKLTNHIITTVYEGLLKLGTSGDESYSIYYDLDLLNYLLDTNFESKDACFQQLQQLYSHPCTSDSFENQLLVAISLEKGRFRFTVPASSMEDIRTHGEKNHFLSDIIELVKSHHFTLEDVKEVFARYSDDYICEKTSHPEFQYVLYFTDEEINHYKYCFTFDGCGGYYHRLLDYDYQKILDEEV